MKKLYVLLAFSFSLLSIYSFGQGSCSTAQLININTTSQTFIVTGNPGSPALTGCTSSPVINEYWFYFTASTAHSAVTFNNMGSQTAYVYIYQTCASTSEIICMSIAQNTMNLVNFATTSGQPYYIRVLQADAGGTVIGCIGVYSNPGTNAILCVPDKSAFSTGTALNGGGKTDNTLTAQCVSGMSGYDVGWAKFNTTLVPQSAITINAIDFGLTYQSGYCSAGGRQAICKLKNDNIDPVTATVAQFYVQSNATTKFGNDIGPTYPSNTVIYQLNAAAIANFPTRYTQGWWGILIPVEWNDGYWPGDGISYYGWNSNYTPYIVVEYTPVCNIATFTTQPVSPAPQCSPAAASFTVAATGDFPVNYQWQLSNGTTWTNLTDGGSNPSYSGSNNTTLNVTGATATLQYRCVAINCSGTNTASNPATLLIANQGTINLGKDTTITTKNTITLDAGPGFISYLWSDNSNNETLVVDGSVLGVGTFNFSVTVTNINGCTATGDINIKIINDSNIVTLSMPDIIACNGDTLIIPVSATNFNNVGSIGIKINYDNTVLNYIGFKNLNAQIDTLNSFAVNGVLSFVWVSSGMNSLNIGNAILFDIVFIYTGGNTSLTFQQGTEITNFNTLTPYELLFVNSTVQGGTSSNISGIVTYDNSVSTPLHNIKVLLFNNDGLKTDSCMTDKSGNYLFSNVGCGKYTIKAVTTEPVGGITPLDALIVNRNFIGVYKFTDDFKKKAADVNNDNKINPVDALMINRYYIGWLKNFIAGNWLFENGTINLSGNNITYNFKGICVGDDNGSYVPAFRMTSDNIFVTDNSKLLTPNSELIEIPVRANRNLELGAIGLKFKVQSSMFKVLDVISNIDGFMYNIVDDEVAVAWTAVDNNLYLNKGDILFYLKVQINPNPQPLIPNPFIGEAIIADGNANLIEEKVLTIPQLSYQLSTNNYQLNQNYPNPFNNSTIIGYTIPEKGSVTLNVTDILGKEIKILVNTKQNAGTYKAEFNKQGIAPGVYLYNLKVIGINSNFNKTRMMIIE